eukprot:scaffold1172_cov74-Skeletonema_dohrnii-CCMP3373.AAC.2
MSGWPDATISYLSKSGCYGEKISDIRTEWCSRDRYKSKTILQRVNFAKCHALWAILHIALWYHTAKPKTHISSKLSEGQYYSFIDSHN